MDSTGKTITAVEFDKNLPQNTDPDNLKYSKTN
jgi:hypothetical protein